MDVQGTTVARQNGLELHIEGHEFTQTHTEREISTSRE